METLETLIVLAAVIGATAWLISRAKRSLGKAAGCEGCGGRCAKSVQPVGTNELVTLRIRKTNREP